VVDEHLTDLAAGVHGDERVDGCVTRIGVQACGQRPALGPSPGSVVDLKCCPEQWPGLRGKEIPRDHQVAGGVSGTKSGEVDDGAELSAADQQVAEVKIAMEPDRGTVSGWRSERGLPYCGHRGYVERALHCRYRSPRRVIAVSHWHAGDIVVGIRGGRFHR